MFLKETVSRLLFLLTAQFLQKDQVRIGCNCDKVITPQSKEMASVTPMIFRYFDVYMDTLLTSFHKHKLYFGNSFASMTNDFTFQKEDYFKTEVVSTSKFPLQFI